MNLPLKWSAILILSLLTLPPIQSTLARGHHGSAGGGPLLGRVVSGADRGLGGAHVIIKGTGKIGRSLERSHRTNRRGHFKFRHLPSTRYAITAMKPGFYPKTLFTTPERRKGLVIHLSQPHRAGTIIVGPHRRGAFRIRATDGHLQIKPVTPLHLPHINGHSHHNPATPTDPKAPIHPGKKK